VFEKIVKSEAVVNRLPAGVKRASPQQLPLQARIRKQNGTVAIKTKS
jgi:hypothetical protein